MGPSSADELAGIDGQRGITQHIARPAKSYSHVLEAQQRRSAIFIRHEKHFIGTALEHNRDRAFICSQGIVLEARP